MPEERARLRQSLKSFKRLLAMEPGHLGHLETLARLCVQLDRPKEAARYLVDRAERLAKIGEPVAALADAQNALRLHARHKQATKLVQELSTRVVAPAEGAENRVVFDAPRAPTPGPLDREPTPPPSFALRLRDEPERAAPDLPAPNVSLADLEPALLRPRDSIDPAQAVSADELLKVHDEVELIDASDSLERSTLDGVEEDDPDLATRATDVLDPVVREEGPTAAVGPGPSATDSFESFAALERSVFVPPSIELDTADLDAAEDYRTFDGSSDEGEDELITAVAMRSPRHDEEEGEGDTALSLPSPAARPAGAAIGTRASVDIAAPASPLATLPPAIRMGLLGGGEPRAYAPGEHVAVAAARFDGLRVLTSGQLSVHPPRQPAEADMVLLEAPALLGAIELVRGGRWRYTATARTESEVVALDSEQVADLRREHPAFDESLRNLAQHEMLASLIAGSKLFAALDASGRGTLANRFRVRFLNEGEPLLEIGDPVDGLFMLAEGRLEVSREGVHLGGLSAGDCVGLVSALDDVPAVARVVAAPVAEVYCLGRSALAKLLEDPSVRASFERAASMRRLLVSRG